MRIGLSLPPQYLVGDPQASTAAAAWQQAFGNAVSFLDALGQAGVTSVELRSVAEDANPEVALLAAQRVWDAGMNLTIHGRLPRPVSGETLAEMYPSLVPLVQALRAHGCQTILTLHCYSESGGNVQTLAERTVLALRKVLDILQHDDVPLQVALEINHVTARNDPGVTYTGILDMIAGVGRPRIGACWDFGHAFMNVQCGQLERVPGNHFLEQVIHTHIHDLGSRTHFPLTYGVVPLDLFLDLLLDHGYAGVLNLELSPERFPESVPEAVWKSIERLTGYARRRARPGKVSFNGGNPCRI